MEICECFDEDTTIQGEPIYRCYGTEEGRDCACMGDKSKCDLYPEKQAKTNNSNVTDIVVEIESILMTSDINWMLSYNPDSKSYSITIFKEDQ